MQRLYNDKNVANTIFISFILKHFIGPLKRMAIIVRIDTGYPVQNQGAVSIGVNQFHCNLCTNSNDTKSSFGLKFRR